MRKFWSFPIGQVWGSATTTTRDNTTAIGGPLANLASLLDRLGRHEPAGGRFQLV